MCATRDECRFFSIRFNCKKECVKRKLDTRMDSQSYSAHMRDVLEFDTMSLNIDVIGNFDLHIFQLNIGFVIFVFFLRFKLSQQSRHHFAHQ